MTDEAASTTTADLFTLIAQPLKGVPEMTATSAPWIVNSYPTKYPDLRTYSVLAPEGWRDPHTGEPSTCSVASGLDSESDARLIAAAPDLLAALHSLVEAIPPATVSSDLKQAAFDAIYRATGNEPYSGYSAETAFNSRVA